MPKVDCKNFIIVSFPRFAGGKFIGNCLSLSRYCCPQDIASAKYLLEHPNDYNYRLDSVIRTLPSLRSEMLNWIQKYEFGDTQFYGEAFSNWINGKDSNVSPLIEKLLNAKFKLFLNAHSGDITVRNLLKVWPKSTIIKLINHIQFSKISKKLKSNDLQLVEEYAGNYCKEKYSKLMGKDWPSWEEFESVGYDIRKIYGYDLVSEEISSFYNWNGIDNPTILIDIDNSIFKKSAFLKMMSDVYKQLEFDDFNPNLVEKFWQSYLSLHVDQVDLT